MIRVPYIRHIAPAPTSTKIKAANDVRFEADAILSSFDVTDGEGVDTPFPVDEGFSILRFAC